MQPTIVTAAIIQKGEQILITQRPATSRHGGMWEFPGGKLEPGEAPIAGLRREIREELALEIQVGPIFEVIYHCYDWGAVLILAYLARAAGETVRHLEVADHRWITPGDLHKYPILPADRPIIARLQSAPLPAWE